MAAEPRYMERLCALLNDYPDTLACGCVECRDMCVEPCWPLPHQAVVLMRKGYGYALDVHIRRKNRAIPCPVLAPKREKLETGTKSGVPRCVLQDEAGKCSLHDLGLKPFEGRVVDHASPPDGYSTDALRDRIADLWDTVSGRMVVRWWAKHHGTEEEQLTYGKIPTQRGGYEEAAVAEMSDIRP